MFWIFLGVIFLIIFVISKSGPVENIKPPSNTLTKDYIEFNSADYEHDYIFDVSGVHLEHNLHAVLNYCKLKSLITLEPEPNNKFDTSAILVKSSGWEIGYVPATETDEVHEILKKEHVAYVLEYEPLGFINVTVRILYNT